MRTYIITTLISSLFFVVACQKEMQEKSPEQKIFEWQPAYLTLGDNVKEHVRLGYCFKNKEDSANPLNRIYPEHFGGVYTCTSDRTKTVICLTDTSEQTKKDIIALCQLSPERYIFQKCDFSKNEMLQIMRKLNAIPNLYEEWDIIDISILTPQNKVNIHFNGLYDENKITLFQQSVYHHPALSFSFALDKDMPMPQTSNSTILGANISSNQTNVADSIVSLASGVQFVTSDRNKGRIGITAYLGNTQGFITAKHVVKRPNVRTYTYKDEENFGTLFGECIKIAQVTDIAFCSLNANVSSINTYHSAYHSEPMEPDFILIITEKLNHTAFVISDISTVEIDGERISCRKFQIAALVPGIKRGDSGALILDSKSKAGGIVIGIDPSSLKNDSYYKGYFIGGTECVYCLGATLKR